MLLISLGKIRHVLVFFCLVALASVLWGLGPSLLFASKKDTKQVLILHSYHAGLNWTDEIMEGIREVFSLQPIPPQMYVEYMDSRRNESPEYLCQVLDDFLARKFKEKRFDLILLSDNNALDFVRRHREDLFAGVPVVFCGINKFTPSMIKGMGRITGVAENPEIEKTIELALTLHPETEEVIFIGRTDVLSGMLNDEMVHAAIQKLTGRATFTFWNNIPLEELQARLPRLSPGRLVFPVDAVRTAMGKSLSFIESVREIRQATRVPLYSFWDVYFGDGIVGGKLVTGRNQGQLAAQLAVRILAGENPESIPVVTSESNPYKFDYRELKRFGIALKKLPEGSVVEYRPPPFYEISKQQLWVALALMVSLSVALLVAMLGRLRAVTALGISEERFRSVINSSPMGIHQYRLEPDGRLVLTGANPATDVILGVNNQALIGKPLEEAFPSKIDRELPERFREVCAQGRLWYAEHVVYEGQDLSRVYEVYAFSTGPGTMACMFSDVTERKRAQDQIWESKQMLQLILDYIPQHVFWKDRNLFYLGCNRNFAKVAGAENPEDLIGKTDHDLPWKREEAESYREGDRRVMESDTPELHIIETQLQASGKQAWLDTNKIPLHDGEGRVVGILGTFEDITERKRAEENLVEANRELEAFVYTVSHDLRSPLTPIIGYADYLRESCQDRLNEQELNCLSEISISGHNMSALMEDLLSLAKVGQVERPAEPIALEAIVSEVLHQLSPQLSCAGVRVEVGDLPALRVSKSLLSQIFANLIGNALQYGCKTRDVIEVGGERRGEAVRLYVRDHGPGIPAEERGRIFEVFYRGTTAKEKKGTGIGLATIQKIARYYDGRAWVEETPGGGSTFWVEMMDVETAAKKEEDKF